ncbi:MAG: DUF4131 domain-containing protein, partial [Planctomycetes bacterium]|nr:DUF4131 domain-containing protein [Planctomycetota bacterium]
MPVALAVTAGIVIDRHAGLPIGFSLIGALVGLIAWAVSLGSRQGGLPLVFLAGTLAALGAAFHHHSLEVSPTDIGRLATSDPRTVRVRGEIWEEPAIAWRPARDPLQSIPRPDSTLAVLCVTQVKQPDEWQPVTGRARLVIAGQVLGIHVGDQVEVVGWLLAPPGPANPGEFDEAAFLRDQRIHAQIVVQKTPEGIT